MGMGKQTKREVQNVDGVVVEMVRTVSKRGVPNGYFFEKRDGQYSREGYFIEGKLEGAVNYMIDQDRIAHTSYYKGGVRVD